MAYKRPPSKGTNIVTEEDLRAILACRGTDYKAILPHLSDWTLSGLNKKKAKALLDNKPYPATVWSTYEVKS